MAVIGAGFGGIAVAYHLKRLRVPFTAFEQSPGPGGTWWDNTYPGCEVDLHSHLYSYSFFHHYDWPRTHNRQPEVQRYLATTIERFGLSPHFRYDSKVESVTWHEESSGYRVRLASGEEHNHNVVATCLGLLNYPHYPDWPGLIDFRGPKFHTARWEHGHDLLGKRIAVVGTGSTSAQVVPNIADKAGHLYVFQREPGWVLPKGARDLTDKERERFQQLPFLTTVNRLADLRRIARRMNAYSQIDGRFYKHFRNMALDYIDDTIQDPATRAAVTPDYPFGCKRPVIDDNFYTALNRENVELVPQPVTRITPTGVVAADGVERAVDVLIMATGFQPTRFFASLDVIGPEGRPIQELWGDAESFLGMTVAGMPNFFMLYGPNTNGGGSVCGVLERQAEVLERVVRRMMRHGFDVVETRRTAQHMYMWWLERQIRKGAPVWEGGCHSYYFSDQGRNVTQLPVGAFGYWLLTGCCRLRGW